MKRVIVWIFAVSTAYIACGCGGGGKALAVATARAKDEQPSVEVCLDRLEDVRVLSLQLDDFALRTPVGPGAPWVERIKAIPADRAMAIGAEAQTHAPYDLPGSRVSASKIYVMYNEQILAEAAAYTGPYMSFMDGLAALGVPEAGKIKNKYDGVKANHMDIAETEGTIEGLEAEADLDTTPSRRKNAIAGQVEGLKKQLESLEERNATAEEALYAEITAMKARGPVGPDMQPLAATLFFVSQHAARMEEETMVTSRLAMIQLARALPALPQELQSMASRLMTSVMEELGQAADAARGAQINVSLDGGTLAINVSGLGKVDPGAVQQSLMRRLTIVRDQVTGAPTTAAKSGAMARFEHDFFMALAEALGALSGNVYTAAADLPLPGVKAGTGPGLGAAPSGPGAGGGSWGAPPPTGGYGAPPTGGTTPPTGGYGAPPTGGYGAPPTGGTVPPPTGGYGAPPTGGYGAPPIGGTVPPPTGGTVPPPTGGTVPPPTGGTVPPPTGGTVPPPTGGTVPPPPTQCPASLCGGRISSNGVGQIALKMPGRDAAKALARRIAPKTDASHPEPTENVNGVMISFCKDLVCRIEVTVNPPATAEGFGVGSKFSQLAKKYGQSKCAPIDAKRFGVEFEKMPGVFWISDKLDCEGIEDIDFWDRPLPGTVKNVVVGTPVN